MDRIHDIQKLTDNPHLNLYALDASFRDGSRSTYYVASRRRDAGAIRAATHDRRPDGVIICGVYGPGQDRLVLIRQYRYPIDGYVYELPAGLIDPGEYTVQAAVREMREETGFHLQPLYALPPCYMSVGMTDESCATVFGLCSGEPTCAYQEGSEDIQVILADKAECRRILAQEQTVLPCAYILMQFLLAEPGHFLRPADFPFSLETE